MQPFVVPQIEMVGGVVGAQIRNVRSVLGRTFLATKLQVAARG